MNNIFFNPKHGEKPLTSPLNDDSITKSIVNTYFLYIFIILGRGQKSGRRHSSRDNAQLDWQPHHEQELRAFLAQ